MTATARRVALARIQTSGEVELLALQARWSGRYVQITRWDDAPRRLAERAVSLALQYRQSLPPARASTLSLDYGVVEGSEPEVRRTILAVVAGGGAIHCTGSRLRWPGVGWTGEMEWGRLGASTADYPILLAPSAVQDLAIHLIGGPDRGRVLLEDSGLRVENVTASPHPLRELGQSPAGDDSGGELTQLLTRLDQFATPLIDSFADRSGSLRVVARRAARPRRLPALLLESLQVNAQPGVECAPCSFQWSLLGTDGTLRAGARPARATINLRQLLHGSAAIAGEQAAHSADPIQGPYWGWAPPLRTAAVLGSLQ